MLPAVATAFGRGYAPKPVSMNLPRLANACRKAQSQPECIRFAEEVIVRVGPQLRHFVATRCPESDVEDVYQDVLLAVATSLPKFEGASDPAFWSWCYRIAQRRLADFYRSRGKLPTVSIDIEEVRREVEGSTASPEVSEADRLALSSALELLGKVKPPCVDYLHAYYILDLDYPEMAVMFHSKADAMRMRVNRCLALANALLTQHG